MVTYCFNIISDVYTCEYPHYNLVILVTGVEDVHDRPCLMDIGEVAFVFPFVHQDIQSYHAIVYLNTINMYMSTG